MIVLADMGNTRIKWASLNGEILGPVHHMGSTPQCFEGFLDALDERIDALCVASVLGEAAERDLQAACEAKGLSAAWFARTQAAGHGISIAYAQPERLGVDRYLAMVAARARTNTPFIVIDCGTAVKLDAVDAKGRHLGGLILPGLVTARASWRDVPRLAQEPAGHTTLFANNTADALQSGIELGLAKSIDGLCLAMAQSMAAPPVCWLSGGDAQRLALHLQGEYSTVPTLVLEGLAIVSGH